MKSQSNHNIRSFLMGVLTTLLVLGLSVPALAAATKTIDVFTGVSIYIDDVKLNPTDAAGNPVEPFIYNGTTYLPVRAVSEALGKAVQWDGATQSVYIGKHSSDTPAAYLSQMDYFNKNGFWTIDNMVKDNLGVDHTHTIKLSRNASFYGDITYRINGQYSRLTGSFFLDYDYRDSKTSATMIIYGDGRELWRGTVDPRTDPIDIDINITGVLELKLEQPNGAGTGCAAALGDMALWTQNKLTISKVAMVGRVVMWL